MATLVSLGLKALGDQPTIRQRHSGEPEPIPGAMRCGMVWGICGTDATLNSAHSIDGDREHAKDCSTTLTLWYR